MRRSSLIIGVRTVVSRVFGVRGIGIIASKVFASFGSRKHGSDVRATGEDTVSHSGPVGCIGEEVIMDQDMPQGSFRMQTKKRFRGRVMRTIAVGAPAKVRRITKVARKARAPAITAGTRKPV